MTLGQNTAVGTFSNVIAQIQNLPNMDLGRKFRTPCKTGNKCGKVISHDRTHCILRCSQSC